MRPVLLIGPLPPPLGGVATHLMDLSRALRARAVPVELLDPRRIGPDGSDARPGLAQLRRRHPLLLACALAPGPEYGAALMLDAFARVQARRPSTGLILFGPGTRALAPEVRARGLARAVALYGELDRPRALAVI